MKDKFEEAIKKEIYVTKVAGIIGAKEAANACNTLHQQAMKEKTKEILVLVESNLALFFNKPKDIGYYNAVKHLVKVIAKENNIKL